jgi:hypothetical protein
MKACHNAFKHMVYYEVVIIPTSSLHNSFQLSNDLKDIVVCTSTLIVHSHGPLVQTLGSTLFCFVGT